MIRIAFAAALLLLPSAVLAEQNEPFKPGLGEIMTLQQMRHLKLWFAVQAGNWGLADYELDELKEGFEDITKYYPTKDDVPTGTMAEAVVAKEVAALAKAIEAKDKKAFAGAFDRLTASCNACHQASKHAFIAIRRPSGNPYTNQSFTPAAGKSDVRHDRH
jgi:cytochrome c553